MSIHNTPLTPIDVKLDQADPPDLTDYALADTSHLFMAHRGQLGTMTGWSFTPWCLGAFVESVGIHQIQYLVPPQVGQVQCMVLASSFGTVTISSLTSGGTPLQTVIVTLQGTDNTGVSAPQWTQAPDALLVRSSPNWGPATGIIRVSTTAKIWSLMLSPVHLAA